MQPLRRSALRARLPHGGHLEARRRHRDDGLAPLHRLPLLHGGLPVRLAQLQLVGPAAVHPQAESDFPTRTKGVVEKCNFCEERLAEGRAPACVEACPQKAIVFGDLNDEQSTVRQLLRTRYAVQRKPELGTGPSVFYLV